MISVIPAESYLSNVPTEMRSAQVGPLTTKHLLEITDLLKKKRVVFKVLNLYFDTSTPTGKLMQTMLAAVAELEREMMLERHAEWILIAKALGELKGRKPTAREKSGEVLQLLADGLTKDAVAEKVGIVVASVYRMPERPGSHRKMRKAEKSARSRYKWQFCKI